jgi:hypothetical protein
MAEPSHRWDGGLTVSARHDGTDSYDFGSRVAAVTSLKSGLRLPEMTPLPSPWTLEIEPTLLKRATDYDVSVPCCRARLWSRR